MSLIGGIQKDPIKNITSSKNGSLKINILKLLNNKIENLVFDKNKYLFYSETTINEFDYSKISLSINKESLPLSLLLSEMQFFNYYLSIPNAVCLIIGETDEIHIKLLMNLYPTIEFHYYSKINNIKDIIYHPFDTLEKDFSKWYSFRERLFIISNLSSMIFQKKIIDSIDPFVSILNINTHQDFEYFNGILLLPQFSNSLNRLIVFDNNSSKTWNSENYENSLKFHNFIIRNANITLFLNPITATFSIYNNLPNSYDYISMCYIIIDYLIKFNIVIELKTILPLFKIFLEKFL